MAFWNKKKGYADIKGSVFRHAGENFRSPEFNTEEVLKSYDTSPWIYAALFRVASDISLTRWTVLKVKPRSRLSGPNIKQKGLWKGGFSYRNHSTKILLKNASNKIDSADVQEVDHPILDILDKPNPVQNGWEFMYALVCHLELDGNAFIKIVRDAHGNPMHLYTIEPHRLTTTPTKADPYFYTSIGGGTSSKIPERDVIWIRRPRPLDVLGRGTGTVKSLAHEIDLDGQVIQHTLGFFKNSATPDLLIGLGENAREEDVNDAAAAWKLHNQGIGNAHGVHFYSGKISVDQLGSSIKDLEIVPIRNHTRNTIIQAIGLPPEQLGIIENSNRSTIDSATYLYTTRVLMPRISQIWYALQYELMPQFIGQVSSLIFSYESPVPEDKEFILKVSQSVPEVLTINEWRELAGKGPIPGGDKMYSPTTYSNEDNKDGESKPKDSKKNDK